MTNYNAFKIPPSFAEYLFQDTQKILAENFDGHKKRNKLDLFRDLDQILVSEEKIKEQSPVISYFHQIYERIEDADDFELQFKSFFYSQDSLETNNFILKQAKLFSDYVTRYQNSEVTFNELQTLIKDMYYEDLGGSEIKRFFFNVYKTIENALIVFDQSVNQNQPSKNIKIFSNDYCPVNEIFNSFLYILECISLIYDFDHFSYQKYLVGENVKLIGFRNVQKVYDEKSKITNDIEVIFYIFFLPTGCYTNEEMCITLHNSKDIRLRNYLIPGTGDIIIPMIGANIKSESEFVYRHRYVTELNITNYPFYFTKDLVLESEFSEDEEDWNQTCSFFMTELLGWPFYQQSRVKGKKAGYKDFSFIILSVFQFMFHNNSKFSNLLLNMSELISALYPVDTCFVPFHLYLNNISFLNPSSVSYQAVVSKENLTYYVDIGTQNFKSIIDFCQLIKTNPDEKEFFLNEVIARCAIKYFPECYAAMILSRENPNPDNFVREIFDGKVFFKNKTGFHLTNYIKRKSSELCDKNFFILLTKSRNVPSEIPQTLFVPESFDRYLEYENFSMDSVLSLKMMATKSSNRLTMYEKPKTVKSIDKLNIDEEITKWENEKRKIEEAVFVELQRITATEKQEIQKIVFGYVEKAADKINKMPAISFTRPPLQNFTKDQVINFQQNEMSCFDNFQQEQYQNDFFEIISNVKLDIQTAFKDKKEKQEEYKNSYFAFIKEQVKLAHENYLIQERLAEKIKLEIEAKKKINQLLKEKTAFFYSIYKNQGEAFDKEFNNNLEVYNFDQFEIYLTSVWENNKENEKKELSVLHSRDVFK